MYRVQTDYPFPVNTGFLLNNTTKLIRFKHSKKELHSSHILLMLDPDLHWILRFLQILIHTFQIFQFNKHLLNVYSVLSGRYLSIGEYEKSQILILMSLAL